MRPSASSAGSLANKDAKQLRRRRPRPGDKWQMDEVFLTIKGERHYLWRAVDQEGNVLDILVQRRRDKRAAKKFFRKLLKGLTRVPRVIVTDKLQSDGAASERSFRVWNIASTFSHNHAENSYQPTRQQERRMQRFKSPGRRSVPSLPMGSTPSRTPTRRGRHHRSPSPYLGPASHRCLSGSGAV